MLLTAVVCLVSWATPTEVVMHALYGTSCCRSSNRVFTAMSDGSYPSESLRLAMRLVTRLTLSPRHSDHKPPSSEATQSLAATVLKFLAAFESISLPDTESGTVDSIGFYLRHHADRFPSGSGVRFDELYQKLTTCMGEGALRTQILLLLFSLSRQRAHETTRSQTHKINIAQTVDAQLFSSQNCVHEEAKNDKTAKKGSRKDGTALKKNQLPAVRVPSVSPPAPEVRSEPVPAAACESLLVHDVLYICQGIDGRYIKFNNSADETQFVVLDPCLPLSGPMRQLVLHICELGFLFKKVHRFSSSTSQRLADINAASSEMDANMDVCGGGALKASNNCFTSQAFSYAVSKELAEYYRLMAVLESRATGQKEGEQITDGALTLRRLSVWLTEAARKMRILAVLVDSISHLKGGALASALYAHSRTGEPFAQKFIMRLLRKVSVPIFNMIKTWVFEGEFKDPHREFFIVDNVHGQATPHGFDLWRMGYAMNQVMLPGFLSPKLAEKILRAGKSINFLRSRCGDVEWVQERASTSSTTDAVSYTNLEALQALVEDASSKVDRRLIQIMTQKYSLPVHFKALRRYILLGQGDFVQALLDCLRPELDKEMSKISEAAVMGCIRTAIHSSDAMYDDEDVLDRLCMKKIGTFTTQTGWDGFALDYRIDPSSPLSAVIPPATMVEYQQVFRLLWRLKKTEGNLNECWKGLKCISRGANRPDLGMGNRVRELLLMAFNLRSKLAHFCVNFQHYVMFEVLEGAWKDFTTTANKAADLDALIYAHESYMRSILSKCLLDDSTTAHELRTRLADYFRLIDNFTKMIIRLVCDAEQILHFLYARLRGADGLQNWEGSARPEVNDVPIEYYHEMKNHFAAIVDKYEIFIHSFTEQVSGEAHIDLRFLMFRLEFDETVNKQDVDAEAMISEETMQE